MKPVRRYIAACTLSAVIALFAVAGINLLADPYHYFGTNWTGEYAGGERQLKLRLHANYAHNGLLLGNSKVGYIDPDGLVGAKFYNASFPGALPEEIYYYLQEVLDDQKIVVIGFDLEMFNEGIYKIRSEQEFKEKTTAELVDQLFGWPVLRASVSSLYRYVSGRPAPIHQNGMTDPEEANFRDRQMMSVRDDPRAVKMQLQIARQTLYRDFRFSEQRLEVLKSIKTLLEEREVRYVVFINPLSSHVMGLFENLGLQPSINRLHEALRQVFGQAHDFSRFALDRPESFFSFDPVHFKPALGIEIVNQVLCGLNGAAEPRPHDPAPPVHCP